MKLLFWLVRNKVNKKGEIPIYCRITINGSKIELGTGICVGDGDFDPIKKRIKGNTEVIIKQNRILEELAYKLNNIYYNEVLCGREVTANDIKTLFQTKRKQVIYFVDLLNSYALERFAIYKNEIVKKLHERYISTILKALRTIGEIKIRINNADTYFLEKLTACIISELKYSISYTKKIFGFIKSALTFAFNRKYTDSNYASNFRIRQKEKTEIVYLEEWEVEKILNYQFDESLQRIADVFIVQCYTGLAYVDLKRLNAQHLTKDDDGFAWINITRQKVENSECTIPVVKKAWAILKKYSFVLPVLSNQKYNDALKKIAIEVGIRKNLTTHVGRKTFGTLLLNKDVPIETVSKLLGHSSIKTTQQHYAKVLHMKIAKDVRLVM